MNILLTGVNGIIGKQLIENIYKIFPDSNIIILVRNKLNINNNLTHQVICDIQKMTIDEIDLLFSQYKPQIFIHLAWYTSHTDYLTSEENNKWLHTSISMVNKFYKYEGKRFIGIGTSLEYDWNENMPLKENETKLTGSNFLYGQSKLKLFEYLEKNYPNKFIWCRIFFVFGPYQDLNRFIPKLISSFNDKDIKVSFNRYLKRDYISTFEISKQITILLKSNYTGAVNICSGISIELGFFCDSICKILDNQSDLSKDHFKDNFEISSIYGNQDILKSIMPNYSYTMEDIYHDLEKTILYYKN